MCDEFPQGLMVDVGEIGIAEEVGELLQIGKIAPLGVRRNVSFGLEILEEIEDMLAHEITLA
jgi:hypothetical protein